MWWFTELIECMPIREWHRTRRLPSFALPKRSRQYEDKDSDGKIVMMTEYSRPEYEGEDGKTLWMMDCKELKESSKQFDRWRSKYCRLLLSSITLEVLDGMRSSATYVQLETDREIPDLFDLAELIATGHGAASIYLDFLRLSELKCTNGDYMRCNQLYKERRRMIESRATTDKEAKKMLMAWMDAIYIMAMMEMKELTIQMQRLWGARFGRRLRRRWWSSRRS